MSGLSTLQLLSVMSVLDVILRLKSIFSLVFIPAWIDQLEILLVIGIVHCFYHFFSQSLFENGWIGAITQYCHQNVRFSRDKRKFHVLDVVFAKKVAVQCGVNVAAR